MLQSEYHTSTDAAARFTSLYDSGPSAKALAEALQQGGVATATCLTKDLELGGVPDGPLLAVYTRPCDWIASAIEEGRSASEALEGWIVEAGVMVNLCRLNRRGVRLVDAAAAYADPKRFNKLLAGKVPLTRLPDPPAAPDAALVALAEALLITSPQAQILVREQEAATVNLASEARLPTISGFNVLSENYRTALEVRTQLENEVRRACARAADLQDSYTCVRRTEVKLQRENQQILLKLEILQQEHTRLIAQQNELETRLSAFDELETRARQAEEQALQMGKDLDSCQVQRNNQIACLERQIAEQQMMLQSEIAERERILRSHSIRVTAPLRRLRALFGQS